MGVKKKVRPWVAFASSSGQTFFNVWQALSPEVQDSFQGFFVDRPCRALERAKEVFSENLIYSFEKKSFEAECLPILQSKDQPLIFLCGFFGILSERFLEDCGAPVLNTHPSLLPAFTGLDKKVHARAFEQVPVSGFSVHLVNEELDGGPILFQHPVYLEPGLNVEEAREKVRAAEQKWLPAVLLQIFQSKVTAAERHSSGQALRSKHALHLQSFQDLEREITS